MSKKSNPNIVFDEGVRDRFLSKLKNGENGCIEWTDALNSNGYGDISVGGKSSEKVMAHRWAMGFSHGGVIIPSEVLVCHHCDNRSCVNPAHLFLGSQQDNMTDMKNKGRAAVSFGNAKLNWELVDLIRSSSEPGTVLAKKLGVSKATISEVRNNVIWKEEHREVANL